MQDIITIYAEDCSIFHNQEGHTEAIQFFIANRKLINIFQLETKAREDQEIAYFNYKDAKWYAGRLIGESFFSFNQQNYKIVITPRFGNIQLFKMLEEIYNIKFLNSKTSAQKQSDYTFIVKTIISFLWLNLLSKANKHGIPRNNVPQQYKGSTVRGKIDVRKSIQLIYTEKKIVSHYSEKIADATITKILASALKILKSEYNLGVIKQSLASKNAIEQINSSHVMKKHIAELDYKKIKYNAIYLPFKPVVDLSWDIIKGKNFGNNEDQRNDGISFFLDMAEIWEIYLRNILKKELAREGWILKKDVILTYTGTDFSRKLIPDIVFEKGDDIMVWDAKYKRMKFDYFDYDRTDFFQIHTYISYYKEKKNVFAGGLLYPLSNEFNETRQLGNKSCSLFSESKTQMHYIIDGIDYSQINEDKIIEEEQKFLKRISSLAKF